MFSTNYTCSDCGNDVTIKKFLFKAAKIICPKCGSNKLTKAAKNSKTSCGCNSNSNKKSRFT